jgi:isoleucyl-tRNA synthetase
VISNWLFGDASVAHNLLNVEDFLKTLFIVSDAAVTDEGFLGCSSPDWVHSKSVSISGDASMPLRSCALS